MSSKKIKIITIAGLLIFFAIEIGGVLYFLSATKPLSDQREQALDAAEYLGILDWQRAQDAKIIAITGAIFAIGLIALSVFFSIISLRLKKEWDSYSFKCKKCGALFKPKSLKFAFLLSVNDMFYTIIYSVFRPAFFIKCSNCGKRSWCKMEKVDPSFN